jgi:regulator of RNase E activity RraA
MTQEFLKDLERCQVATIVSTLFKKGLHSRFFSHVKPIGPIGRTIVGEAFTIRAIPVREDMRAATASGQAPNMHRRALGAAPDGSIVVFEGRGAADVSPLGDLIALSLVRRGIKAFIADAGMNDIAAINATGLPVYALGMAGIPGGARIQVTDWGIPIGVGDVAVFPGDIIAADDMGAVCIPAGIAADVAKEALRVERMETFIAEELNRGADLETTYPPNTETLARFDQWLKANHA